MNKLVRCLFCKKIRPKPRTSSWKKYYSHKGCSRRCGIKLRTPGWQSGSRNHLWKGGRHINPKGYVVLQISGIDESYRPLAMEMRQRYNTILEHRFVMAKHLGRPLARHEIVHHRNQVRTDNRISNLELILLRNSGGHHGSVTCPNCKFEFGIK